MMIMKRWLLFGMVLLLACMATGCMIQPIQPTDAGTQPIKGAAGLGDKLFPNAGNGGYDVQHYDLDLAVDIKSNIITGTATLTALATSTLDTFNLDFHELRIDGLTVNGVETPYQRQDDELIIDPVEPLQADTAFAVTVHYYGKPKPIEGSGWLNYLDRVAVSNGSLGAATWYPVNNHPVDKATYSYRVTVPLSYVVVANGQLLGEETAESGWTTYRWATAAPTASYLATLMIDHYVLQSSTAENLYNNSVYYRAPLALQALRLRLGDERFFELLRTFYARYQGSNASTADFIALAEEVSGEDLTAFFQSWLYEETLPPLPEN